MKRFLFLMAFMIAVVLCSPMAASAQDVWIYTNADTNETVYVEDESSTWTPRTSRIGSVIIKWVNQNNECTARQMWTFSSDEGYLWANRGNSEGFAIACKEEHAGNSPIHDRPDLFAAYQWLVKRHSNNAPLYDRQIPSAQTAEIPGFCGSGIATFADLSSAVLQPSEYTDVKHVAVCTKRVYRSGKTEDSGIWYFTFYDQTGHITVKTNGSGEYAVYNDWRHSDPVKQHFWEKLWNAAKSNKK